MAEKNEIQGEEIVFSFDKIDYDLDIKYDKNSEIISEKIYPITASLVNLKTILYYQQEYQNKIFGTSCIPEKYFISDKQNKQFPAIEEYVKHVEPLLAYDFMSSVSIYVYILLGKFELCKPNDKILVVSNDYDVLDAVIYYVSYILVGLISEQVYFYSYDYNKMSNQNNYMQKFIENHKVNTKKITFPLNNKTIEKYQGDVPYIDLCVIDISILPSDTNQQKMNLAGGYSFQSTLSSIILSIQKLNIGGTLIVNTFCITNELAFNFYGFLANHFESNFVYEPIDTDMRIVSKKISPISFMVFKNYQKRVSDFNMQKILEVNKTNYQNDPTGGLLYEITNDKTRELFMIEKINSDSETDSHSSSKPPPNYLLSIFLPTNKNNMLQDKYRSYIKSKMMDTINFYTTLYTIYSNRENKDFVLEQCKISYQKAIFLAKKYNLSLSQWIEKDRTQYIDQTIIKYIKDMPFSKVVQFSPNKYITNIGVYKCTDVPNHSNLRKNFELNELAYQYTEKINIKKYVDIELLVNNGQKNLNKSLNTDYKIGINGKYVSRAWIKMYELLFDTRFFENLQNKKIVSGFHICEAPGNFINSIIYYLKYNTNIEKYDWKAQSLAADKADFYDIYGFIKKTQSQWDLGPKKTGDITDWENFQYYYKTYGSKVDILVSDCGKKWDNTFNLSKNLAIYQMIYAILFPGEGGNFIIKTFSVNYEKLYLSLLYITTSVYEKVYTFKSNTNFWSPEIYIIGINKRSLTDNETKSLLSIASNTNKNILSYPFDSLPDNFCSEYEKIMYEYILVYTNVKIFFVFLSKNSELLKNNKEKLIKIINDKNKQWGQKYIKGKFVK